MKQKHSFLLHVHTDVDMSTLMFLQMISDKVVEIEATLNNPYTSGHGPLRWYISELKKEGEVDETE